jgi:shikimate dehydrogenase
MMNAALGALGMDGWRYQLLPVPPERFVETVRALADAGFVGANVTIPHKHSALELADTAGEAARAIGAANTLTFAADGAIAAENTDAPGFLAALAAIGVSPRGMSAQVLGAGGSARAVVWALREAGAREVSVWNRTRERAEALARDLGARAVVCPESAELLVNCTSVGLASEPVSELEAGPESGVESASESGLESERTSLRQSATEPQGLNLLAVTFDQVGTYSHVVDLVYRTSPTPLLAAAQAHGVHTVGGLEILLAQGALSFELWTGIEPPLDVMRSALQD